MNRKAHDSRIVLNIGNAGVALTPEMGGANRRQRGNGGFTLAETLLAVLILLLVSTIVATGMPAAVNAYNKVIVGANAKVMLSTAITALHDEIGTAWRVEPGKKNDGTVDLTKLSYFNGSTGAKSMISKDEKNRIWIEEYYSLSTDLIHDKDEATMKSEHPQKDHALVADSRAGMYVTYTGISYEDGIVTIEGLKVCKDDADSTVLVEFSGVDGTPKDFTIRVISKDLVEADT